MSAGVTGYDNNTGLAGFPALPTSGAPPSRLNPRAPDFNQPSQPPMVQHPSQVLSVNLM